ncbi:MAG: Na+/H+ antiporter subunit E [Campylobacterota bacterium]|nr:Na+/H+ antiporter subunit E [Campylobacterota bacterium]
MAGKFILLFLVWVGLTNSLDIQELLVGAIVAFGVAWFFTENEKPDIVSIATRYIAFTPLFLKSLVKSNIEVAKIVLDPRLPINPGIIKLKTSLTDEYDKLLLANSITLTPGTITVELKDDFLYIHVLDLKTTDKELLQQEIIGNFEKVLLR